MKKIINLRPATEADDIHCLDGELENAEFIFDGAGTLGQEGGNDKNSDNISNYTLVLNSPKTMPAGAVFLAVHTPEPGVKNIIIRNSGGRVAWLQEGVGPFPVTNPRKVIGVREWLVILADSGLYFARWNGKEYEFAGKVPPAPSVTFTARPVALPPYSYTDGESPQLEVSVSVGNDSENEVLDWLSGRGSTCSLTTRQNIVENVKEKLMEFLAATESAGMYVSPIKAVCAWKLNDGSLWESSEYQKLFSPTAGEDEPISLSIVAADCRDGRLFMTLRVSHTPFIPERDDLAVPSEWSEVIREAESVIVSPDKETSGEMYVSSPVWISSTSRGFKTGAGKDRTDAGADGITVRGTMDSNGIPDNIFSIGGKMLATLSDGRILASRGGLPMVCEGESKISGEGLMHLTQSLRSLSSGQFGEFPLYAFCGDGVRALTPDGGSFRDVQLISRDVALSKNSFAPLPDSTCFISKAGVMKIEGTNVTCLTKNMEREFVATDRLLYLYKENALILYNPGTPVADLCFLNTGKWLKMMASSLISHHYAWPSTYVHADGKTGELEVREAQPIAPLQTIQTSTPVAIKTRPIKLGSAFDVKQLTSIEAVWPDGSFQPLKVYGAMRLDKWYFLGLAPRGHVRMRGSGWRFFRIETFAIKNENRYLLPQIMIIYK